MYCWPGCRETTDLLLGAVRLHLRRVVAAGGGIDHRDVLAIVSLLGPLVLLTGTAPVLDRVIGWLRVALWFLALAVLVAGSVAAAGVWTREGRRAALVLCVPVVVSVLMLVLPRKSDLVLMAKICSGAPLVVLLGFPPRQIR